jgi:hypothetical protein
MNELDFNSELNDFELSNNSTNISFCCFQSNVQIYCLKNDKYIEICEIGVSKRQK